MDCPSEENMIRMKLDGLELNRLHFDIPNRVLYVIHDKDITRITNALNELNLGASLIGTEETQEVTDTRSTSNEKKLLWSVLAINLAFFLIEIISGLLSGSMGLIADSLDMLADAIVYGLSLYAVGHAQKEKKRIAAISGYFQLVLAVFGLAEVVRRFLSFEEIPGFQTMIFISVFALTGNAVCLYLLQKSKSEEAHMKASMIFTSNDVIANLGVMAAGVLVYLTNSKYPDLIVGIVVFFLVAKGALRILKLAK